MAQSVERFTRNEKVAGSIPACGSRRTIIVLLFSFIVSSSCVFCLQYCNRYKLRFIICYLEAFVFFHLTKWCFMYIDKFF